MANFPICDPPDRDAELRKALGLTQLELDQLKFCVKQNRVSHGDPQQFDKRQQKIKERLNICQ